MNKIIVLTLSFLIATAGWLSAQQTARYFASAKYGRYSCITGTAEISAGQAKGAGGYEFAYNEGKLASVRYYTCNENVEDPFFHAASIVFSYEDGYEIRKYYDRNGKPAQDAVGLYNRHMKADGETGEYFGTNDDGTIAATKSGYYRTGIKFDKGLITAVEYRDASGAAMADTAGSYGFRYYYDGNDRRVREVNVGRDGSPVGDKDGISEIRTSYGKDENDITVRYFSVSGEPAMKGGKVHEYRVKNDSCGRRIMVSYSGADGKFVMPAEITERDKSGAIIGRHYRDDNGKPVNDSKGVADIAVKYDPAYRILYERYYDSGGKPAVYESLGSCGMNHEYDSRGNELRIESIGTSGKPEYNEKYGFCVKEYSYDNDDKMTEIRFLDGENKPMENPQKYGATRIKIVYDNEQQTKEAVFMSRKGFEIKREYMGMYTELKMRLQNN